MCVCVCRRQVLFLATVIHSLSISTVFSVPIFLPFRFHFAVLFFVLLLLLFFCFSVCFLFSSLISCTVLTHAHACSRTLCSLLPAPNSYFAAFSFFNCCCFGASCCCWHALLLQSFGSYRDIYVYGALQQQQLSPHSGR